MNKELFSYLRLLKIKGIGVRSARLLLNHFDSVEQIFESDACEKIKEFFGNQVSLIKKITHLSEEDETVIFKEMQFMQEQSILYVGIKNENYPSKLKLCEDAPIVLFYKGNIELVENSCIGIVGTRKASAYGLNVTKEFVLQLKDHRPTIVSGFAFGIDIQAHLYAVENDCPTVAVMGTSFSTIYPKQHIKYVDYLIQNNGVILTEYPTWMKSVPELFIRRNRIIAGLSDGVIVVQSATKGGALSTALYAVGYSREVYAIPGRIGDALNEGAMWLIQTQRAQLVLSVKDVISDLNWDKQTVAKKKEVEKKTLDLSKFTEDERKIVELLQEDTHHIDELSRKTTFPMSKLNHLLMMMELNGDIHALPGKIFSL